MISVRSSVILTITRTVAWDIGTYDFLRNRFNGLCSVPLKFCVNEIEVSAAALGSHAGCGGPPSKNMHIACTYRNHCVLIMMTLQPLQLLLLLLCLLYSMITTTDAFPSMLVESNSGCMLELSTEEVIMNNLVVSRLESSRPDLYVGVVVDDDGTTPPTTLSRGPISISSKEENRTYIVKLVNPGQDIPDLQYAIETTEGATFKGGGCNGKRSHGRLKDDVGMELTIHSTKNEIRVWAGWATNHEAVQLTQELVFTPTTTNTNDNKSEAVVVVQPEAAFPTKPESELRKTSEEAVQQEALPTKPDATVEVPGTTTSAAEVAHKDALDAELQVLRDEVKELEHQHNHHDVQPTKPNEQQQHDVQPTKPNEQQQHDVDTKDARDLEHRDTIQRFKEAYKMKHVADKEKKTSPLYKKRSTTTSPIKVPDKESIVKQREELLHDTMKRKKMKQQHAYFGGRLDRWQLKYNRDDSSLDMKMYVYGAIFLVMSTFASIQLCQCLAKQHTKGRRNL